MSRNCIVAFITTRCGQLFVRYNGTGSFNAVKKRQNIGNDNLSCTIFRFSLNAYASNDVIDYKDMHDNTRR